MRPQLEEDIAETREFPFDENVLWADIFDILYECKVQGIDAYDAIFKVLDQIKKRIR